MTHNNNKLRKHPLNAQESQQIIQQQFENIQMSRSRSRSRERIPEGKKIYLSNLDPDVGEEELKTLCEKYGIVESISLKKKGEDITFAFIEFSTVREAEKAISTLNRFEFHGRSLKVQFAKGGNNRFSGGFRGRGGDRGGYRPRGGDREYGNSYGRDNGGRRNESQNTCFNCHQSGHFARECPKPRENTGFRGQRGGRGYERRGYGDQEDRRQRRRSRSGSNDRRRRDRSDD